jgi:hypothetical protein
MPSAGSGAQQWQRCSDRPLVKPFRKPAGAKNCSLRRCQKLGLVEERGEVNHRIMAVLAILEATGPVR